MSKRKHVFALCCVGVILVFTVFSLGFTALNTAGHEMDFDRILHSEEILSVATDYSITSADRDDRTLYLFPAPVRRIENKKVASLDKTILCDSGLKYYVSNVNYGAVFENGRVQLFTDDHLFCLYPDRDADMRYVKRYRDVYGNTSNAVVYRMQTGEEAVFLPSNSGLALEVHMNGSDTGKITLDMDFNGYKVQVNASGYRKILKGEETAAVFYPGFVKYSDGSYCVNEG